MKLAIPALIAAGALGALMTLDGASGLAETEGEMGAGLRYQVLINGRDEGCMLAKDEHMDPRRAQIEMAAECLWQAPRLAQARYWQEKGNGDVALVAADGRVLAEFYPADGVAYESLPPAKPLMALVLQ